MSLVFSVMLFCFCKFYLHRHFLVCKLVSPFMFAFLNLWNKLIFKYALRLKKLFSLCTRFTVIQLFTPTDIPVPYFTNELFIKTITLLDFLIPAWDTSSRCKKTNKNSFAIWNVKTKVFAVWR